MAAIAQSQVSLVKGSDRYVGGGVRPRTVITRRLVLSGVTAADTATAAVLGFSQILVATSAVIAGTPDVPVLVGVSYGTNSLVLGTGPNNSTVHVTVEGAPTIAAR